MYKKCFYQTLGVFLSENITQECFHELKSLNKEKDTLKLRISFVIGKKGRIINEFFTANFKDSTAVKEVLLNKLKERFVFKKPLNNCGRPIPFSKYGDSFYFSVNKQEDEMSLIPYSALESLKKTQKEN